jgi:microcystin degradation protein MlrC
MKIFSGELAHETNTFCKIPTVEQSFHRSCYIEGQVAITKERKGTKSGFGAVYEACDKYGWELTCNLAATANPSGALTSECFETMVGKLLAPLCEKKVQPDGVLLMLHGAMVSERYEDSEGEILKRCREYVGPDVPILVTLDLHGNITQKMVDHANCYIAVRTYPHIDFYEMAWKAADLLQQSMQGEVVLRTVIARRPTLRGLDGGRSQRGPMRDLLDRADIIEQSGVCSDPHVTAALEKTANANEEGGATSDSNDVKIISICAGFTAADIYDCGPSVTVTADVKHRPGSALVHAKAVAETFMDFVWETRSYTSVNHMAPAELVALAQTRQRDDGVASLLLAAEVTDNPGSGHYGDATNVLKHMLEADPPLQSAAFYAICDPDAVQEAVKIGLGNTGTITLGGRHDPNAGGGPLTVRGRVVTLSDGHFLSKGPVCGGTWQNLGVSLLFRAECGVELCVITNNAQALDTSQMRSLGCHPEDKRFIVVKSAHHFRADYGPIAENADKGVIATVDGGGLGSVILKTGKFEKIRRPVWPLDPDCTV